MKKIAIVIVVLLAFTMNAKAQIAEPKDMPQLEFAFQLKVTLGETYSCGETQHGQRIVIPITGGTFEGPNIKGTIVNGGADYQLANKAQNRTELEAIYSIRIRLRIVLNWRLSIASRQTMGCISTFAIGVSSMTVKTPMVIRVSTSRLLLSLRLLRIVNTPG